MQIKTFLEWDYADVFQNKVNEWLENKDGLLEIVDIKYSTTTFSTKILFSAIVIYKEL